MSWKTVKLSDIALCIQPGPFGSQLHNADYSDSGTPIIMPKDMIDGHISHTNLVFVSEEHVKRLNRHQVHEGDLMVARKGDVRKCVYISEKENGWMTGSDCLKVSLNKTICDPHFVYYQLRSPYIGKWLETISIGATMPSLNSGLLGSIKLNLPSIEEQHYISKVLLAYDDLIENNRRQIKLLEEAAQRLYREWFVDFRFPGHEQVSIVDGVPEGWTVKTIEEVASLLRRGISPVYNERGMYTVISQKCIRSSIMDISEARKQEKAYAPELNLQDSDTVICSTGAGTLGRVGQVFGEYKDTTFDSHVTLVRAGDKIGKQYLYFTLKEKEDYLKGMGKGSTNQLELYRDVIKTQKISIPTSTILNQFERMMQPIHEKIVICCNQIKDLTEGRNAVIPRLLAGE